MSLDDYLKLLDGTGEIAKAATLRGDIAGSDTAKTNFTVKTDVTDYVEIIEGITINGKSKAFVSQDTKCDSIYKAAWNDSTSLWDLVSGNSSIDDSKSLGNSCSGTYWGHTTEHIGDTPCPLSSKEG